MSLALLDRGVVHEARLEVNCRFLLGVSHQTRRLKFLLVCASLDDGGRGSIDLREVYEGFYVDMSF